MLRAVTALLFVLGLAALSASPIAASTTGASAVPKDKNVTGTEVLTPTKHDLSPALATIAPSAEAVDPRKPKKEKEHKGFPQIAAGAADTAVQSTVSGLAAPSVGTSFDGIGQGQFGFTVQYAPPDTNGAVGPNHYVETVNVSFAVFNKSGGLLYGPAAINTLFSGFGGLCQTDNDGDPTVIYDQLADRWVIQQFAVTGANGGTVPYLECIAVSQTGDPTGAWNRYSYSSSKFPDYPKLGVWPDAYYMSTNDFNGNFFAGASLWAFDRAKMLAGNATATAQVAHLSSLYGGLLPSSLDGKTQPPAGARNYFMSLGTSSSLYLWRFHVDFTNVANSTVTGPTSIAVAGYTELCNGGTCVPQAGTTQQLDSLADRLMYRLAYRNFGDHESLVLTHSVAPAAGGGGVRWYEVRDPNGTPTVYQESTYAPDTRYRWMPSAAMDQVGNIGVGYTESSSTTNPSIYYTGRLATDALNTMQPETLLMQGTGSQLATLSRWGDYSSMFVDPSDDCTFWYTSEYLTANGTWNWHTRVGTFKFGNCPPGPAPAPTVSSVAPASGSMLGGTSVTINGTNFQSGLTLAASFGGASATNVTFISSSQLTATTPSGTPGAGVNVVVTNPDKQIGTCAGCYTYLAAPTVSAVNPAEGPTAGGTTITVTGSNFAAGLTTVSVGSAAATNVTVTSPTTLTATTPSGAGAVPVVVTVDRQTSNNTVLFNYFVAPSVSSVAPASGSILGGTNVTINGANFSATPAVTFGGVAATNVVVNSPTQLTAVTPPRTAGPADVVVTNNDGRTGGCTGCYTYLPAPTVTAVNPSTGPTAGGTTITVTGSNFAAGLTTVSVGSGAATNVSVTSPTTLTATTPPGAAGAAPVVVTVDRQTSNSTVLFTYSTGPVISNVQASAQRRSASITWTTDVPADSQVEYGTTTSYGSRSSLNTTLVVNHSVGLSGLARFTTYHYRVYSRDAAGQLTVSGDLTFTTR